MKILMVVGARPNFMKAAPILAAIHRHNVDLGGSSSHPGPSARSEVIRPILVHTGQHYSELMSDAFFEDLELPKPDVHLGVGSGTHAEQTAEIMKRFEEVLLRERPDVVVVVGDVNSTLACALVTAKISFDVPGQRPLLAHVEAGLRSFDRSMPEEINRILTDHLCDLLFVTEESGVLNLRREGIPEDKIHLVGNTMIDSLLAFKEKAEDSRILDDLGLRDGTAGHPSRLSLVPYALLTLHRPANVDHLEAFTNILEGLQDLANDCVILFPVHPRTQKRIETLGLEHYFHAVQRENGGAKTGQMPGKNGIRLIQPLGYLDFLCVMMHARLVVTDSGGIQEETTCLGIPCVTVRENTERPFTLTSGTNLLAGVKKEGIRQAIREQLRPKAPNDASDLWDGKSALRILDVICHEFEKRNVSLTGASR
jgi:UDP-N-acetylglucosamine 2-epimerase (non-hydrolysing)